MSKKFIAYLSALGAAFSYSLNQIYNKKLVLTFGVVPALVAVYAVLTIFDFLLCTLFGDFSLPSQRVLLEVVFLSLDGAISILLLFASFKYLPVGVALTLANLSPVFLTVIAFLFGGKLPFAGKLLAIFLVLISIYLITYEGKAEKRKLKAYLYPLGTALGWAVFGWEAFRLQKVYGLNPFAIAFYTSFYMFVVFFAVYLAAFGGKLSKLFKVFRNKQTLQWVLLSGFLTSLGFILSLIPFGMVPPEETPIVEALFTFSTPLGALFSYLLLGEKLNKRQIAGIVLSFLSLVLFFLF
jgi:drug/metabolite transporter (DMT)-like permease